jgi:hypothetical protein
VSYTTEPLPEPVRVKLPGRSSQTLAWAVFRDGRIHACFESENAARALAMRLNDWRKQNGLEPA